MLPPRLVAEVDDLRQRGWKVEIEEEAAFISLIVGDVPTCDAYNKPSTTVLIRVPRAYPDAGPDMFWTGPDLLLSDGVTAPRRAEVIQVFSGKRWRRFSWHRTSSWNPTVDSIPAYMEFILQRLTQR